MSYTYTTNNTTANNSTITLTGAGLGGTVGTSNITLNGGSHVYTTTSTGTSGQIYTTTGTNGVTWATPNEHVMVIKQSPPELEVKGRLVLNGQDLEERLRTIEKVLTIPERDVKLEKKYPKLKKLHDEYIAALGKYRTFEAIKGDEDGTA
jgi:hypothetical protein